MKTTDNDRMTDSGLPPSTHEASTHTSGTWFARDDRTNAQIISPEAGDYAIALIYSGGGTSRDKKGQANARLIAAAPTLLEELAKTTIFLETIVISVFKNLRPDSPQAAYLQGHIELNRAAISKAGGQS